jgi:hypothetical protein
MHLYPAALGLTSLGPAGVEAQTSGFGGAGIWKEPKGRTRRLLWTLWVVWVIFPSVGKNQWLEG